MLIIHKHSFVKETSTNRVKLSQKLICGGVWNNMCHLHMAMWTLNNMSIMVLIFTLAMPQPCYQFICKTPSQSWNHRYTLVPFLKVLERHPFVRQCLRVKMFRMYSLQESLEVPILAKPCFQLSTCDLIIVPKKSVVMCCIIGLCLWQKHDFDASFSCWHTFACITTSCNFMILVHAGDEEYSRPICLVKALSSPILFQLAPNFIKLRWNIVMRVLKIWMCYAPTYIETQKGF